MFDASFTEWAKSIQSGQRRLFRCDDGNVLVFADGKLTRTHDDVLGAERASLGFDPRSHSETLYAFYFPNEKLLFLPDLMFKDAVPPFGFPDW